MSALGYIAAGLSAVFNGSFTSPYKFESVAKYNLHPILFTQYVSIGVFLSSLLVIPFLYLNKEVVDDDDAGTVFSFSWLGVIAGLLLVVALGASFQAIKNIGVALSQGVFGGTAILVSYIWGVVVFQEGVSNIALSVIGVLLLIAGVVCIACNKNLSDVVNKLRQGNDLATMPLNEESFSSNKTLSIELVGRRSSSDAPTGDRLVGILWAVLVGFSGGSILAPSHYASPAEAGLAFIPSFGLGAMIGSPILCLVWFSCVDDLPPLQLNTLPTGILSGLLWNVSNILAVIAIPSLGYGVAYPILQCALFVAGVWGIVVFKEIKGQEITVFFVGGAILISGAVCVAIAS
mmetsp:Transcript_9226/g.13894  ORF Transcript_9226/g.13894 Transcript_9226/m.13894 type:complete len:347 (+) Transcript_9226:44-1084(+)